MKYKKFIGEISHIREVIHLMDIFGIKEEVTNLMETLY